MKKLLLLIIVLLLFPITVFAKTPTLEDALNAVGSVSNVQVGDNTTIDSIKVEKYNIIFMIDNQEHYVPYSFSDNRLSFGNGFLTLENGDTGKVSITYNEDPYILYSLLVNLSQMPRNENYDYSSENIKIMVEEEFNTEFKEPTNTFGFMLNPIEPNKYVIIYNYYLGGDYPIIYNDGNSLNPATGNYGLFVIIMLVSVLVLGIYAYTNRKKKKNA